jgi:hypothetical protein
MKKSARLSPDGDHQPRGIICRDSVQACRCRYHDSGDESSARFHHVAEDGHDYGCHRSAGLGLLGDINLGKDLQVPATYCWAKRRRKAA